MELSAREKREIEAQRNTMRIKVNNIVNPAILALANLADDLRATGYHAWSTEVSNLKSRIDTLHHDFYDRTGVN